MFCQNDRAHFASPIPRQSVRAHRREAREFHFGRRIFGDYRGTQVLVMAESNRFAVRDIHRSVQALRDYDRSCYRRLRGSIGPGKTKSANANRRKLFKQASVADKYFK